MINNCRVCGFIHSSPPWGIDNQSPTFEICDCCGVEFGYEDSTPQSIKDYREKWIKQGTPWFNKKIKPENWSIEEQLSKIPKEFS